MATAVVIADGRVMGGSRFGDPSLCATFDTQNTTSTGWSFFRLCCCPCYFRCAPAFPCTVVLVGCLGCRAVLG